MLVNSAADLQSINTSVTRPNAYALGRDIDASALSKFTPLGGPSSAFNTILDGQGHTISNLKIDSVATNVGLFATVGSIGVVRNLNLTDVHITAAGMPMTVGTLAGENSGTVSNVQILAGTISAESGAGMAVGGLVGVNNGLIEASNSATVVRSGASNQTGALNNAGGLAGTNHGDDHRLVGDRRNNCGTLSLVGGLVGQNLGRLENSFATGNVIAGESTTAGGLIGVNRAGATIEHAHALGNVSVGNSAIAGGLAGSEFHQGA